jgi:hypothetical protein
MYNFKRIFCTICAKFLKLFEIFRNFIEKQRAMYRKHKHPPCFAITRKKQGGCIPFCASGKFIFGPFAPLHEFLPQMHR